MKTKQIKFVFAAFGAVTGIFMSAHALAETKERAVFSLGINTYDLDFVLCYAEPDGSTRIALGDEAARSAFPSIGLWLLNKQPASEKPQVFSVDFYRAEPHLKWRFESGDYEKTADGFRASGVMNGTILDKNADRYMTPLGEEENLTFQLEVTCNDY